MSMVRDLNTGFLEQEQFYTDNRPAPDFHLQDCEYNERDLHSIMGERGVVIGFIKNTWTPESIRRILFMQKYFRRFKAEGYNVCLVVADQPHTLHSFYLSSEVKVDVPLLADAGERAHQAFDMDRPGLVVVGRDHSIRAKWFVRPGHVWMRPKKIVDKLSQL